MHRHVRAGGAALLALAALAGLAPADAVAGDAGSIVTNTRSPDRMINVEARYLAPSACYRIARPQPEPAPAGQGDPASVLRYRLPVELTSAACAGGRTVLKRGFIAYVQPQTLSLELRFVDARGRLLKRETFAVIGE